MGSRDSSTVVKALFSFEGRGDLVRGMKFVEIADYNYEFVQRYMQCFAKNRDAESWGESTLRSGTK